MPPPSPPGVERVSFSDLREGQAGTPLYPTPITSPSQLHRGDHILFQTEDSAPPLHPLYQSALVSSVEGLIKIVSYSRSGLYEDEAAFDTFRGLHKVVYTTDCRYSGRESVSRARWRLESGEEHCYHAVFNNSHFFVSWAKTGKEYLLYDVINGLLLEEGEAGGNLAVSDNALSI